MIYLLNYAAPILGMLLCFYALMSKKIATDCRLTLFSFCLYIFSYLILSYADFFTNHVPVMATVTVRWMMLIINFNMFVKRIK